MDFTDEEKAWLENISSEVPGNDELTAVEQHLRDLAKPQSLLEEVLFELMACVRFGILTDLHCSGLCKTFFSSASFCASLDAA